MLNSFQKSLDDWIMGINDPNAPFNQDDDRLQCNKCNFEGEESQFNWSDDDLRIYCPCCGDVVWEE